MAGDWIKMDIELHEKGEFILLTESIKMEDFATEGMLEDLLLGKLKRFWSWADKQAEIEGKDGVVFGASFQWIDTKLLGCKGFCKAMKAAGWLDHRDGKLIIPNFAEKNGKSAKMRAIKAKRMADTRKQSPPRSSPASESSQPAKEPPEFDPAIAAAWIKLATFYTKVTGKEMKIDQNRRYRLAEALEHSTLDELFQGWRWYLTATSERAQTIRAAGKGIDTFLRADKTRSYIELAAEESEQQTSSSNVDRDRRAETIAYLEQAKQKEERARRENAEKEAKSAK